MKNQMLSVFLGICLAFGFVISEIDAQEGRSVVEEYEVVSERGPAGKMIIYNNGTCDLIHSDGRNAWPSNPVRFKKDGHVLILTTVDKKGIVVEIRYTLVPEIINGRETFKTVWVSATDGGKADFFTIFAPLGAPLNNGGVFNGRMTKVK